MRIRVEAGGLDSATDACRTANHVSALLCESLVGKLGGLGAMAGDDATSAEFAATYDEGARLAVETLTELTHAFIGVGRLIATTASNHREAEAASAAVSAYTGGSLDDDDFVRIAPASPPSCLGADPPSLGPVETFILGHVEGFVWPGADVDLVEEAAAAWRRVGAAVADLDAHCDIAAGFLEEQQSPEIPLALAAMSELRSLVRDTADALVAMGFACEDYADAVRSTHERTLDLLAEIGRMVVEGLAISAIIGGLTGGLGAGAAGTAAMARISAQAPRFHALLTGLRTSASVTAGRLRTARDGLRLAQTRAEKFARVSRNERGSFRLPGGRSPRFEASPKHHPQSAGRASQGPLHGQQVLEESVSVNAATTTRRVGHDASSGDFVVFDETTPGVFHGHVRAWTELTHTMQRALIDAGIADRKGRAISR